MLFYQNECDEFLCPIRDEVCYGIGCMLWCQDGYSSKVGEIVGHCGMIQTPQHNWEQELANKIK